MRIKFSRALQGFETFRPPSRMVVSRSYRRHLVKICEEKKRKKALNVHFSFHPLCCISSNVARVPKSYQGLPQVTKGSQEVPRVTMGYHGLPRVICFNRFPKWISPLFSLVLPVLTNHYIKSSDGGL